MNSIGCLREPMEPLSRPYTEPLSRVAASSSSTPKCMSRPSSASARELIVQR